MNQHQPWPPEQLALLKKLVKRKPPLSSGQLAKEMSNIRHTVSRSAVVAKLARLGIPLPGRPVVANKKMGAAIPKGHHLLVIKKATMAGPHVIPVEGPPPAEYVPFEDLRWHHCREVVGHLGHTSLYCGKHKQAPHPYCAEHAAINYQPVSMKARRPWRR